MRFHVDYDSGDELRFWVVPDNPSAPARVFLFVDHRFLGLRVSNDARPAIRDYGWHQTGEVAFTFDEANLPGLAGAAYLEVYDVDTLTLIYRRAPLRKQQDHKLFRFDTGVAPEPDIDRMMFEHFQMSYNRIENLPEETLGYVLDYHYTQSVYMSGRVNAKQIRDNSEKWEYVTAVVFDDPFLHLARQLRWLRSAAVLADDRDRRWRVAEFQGPIAFARRLDFSDSKALRRAFADLDDECHLFLSDPITRQFGCSERKTEIGHPEFVAALEEISHVTTVGHSTYWDAFVRSLAAATDVDLKYAEVPRVHTDDLRASAVLRGLRPVRDLLEHDVAIVGEVERIVGEQWSSEQDGIAVSH